MDDERRAQFETYEDEKGEWRWRVRAKNGEIVIPPESHRDETDAKRAIVDASHAMKEAATNPVIARADAG